MTESLAPAPTAQDPTWRRLVAACAKNIVCAQSNAELFAAYQQPQGLLRERGAAGLAHNSTACEQHDADGALGERQPNRAQPGGGRSA